MKKALLAALPAFLPLTIKAETPDEWIALGARIHGAAFGSQADMGLVHCTCLLLTQSGTFHFRSGLGGIVSFVVV
jgi:hypothetical protein